MLVGKLSLPAPETGGVQGTKPGTTGAMQYSRKRNHRAARYAEWNADWSCSAATRQGSVGRGECWAGFSAIVIASPEVVDKHLLHRLIVGDEHVANGASANEVTNFLGEILGVISGALQ